jgi:excisionase family DNA binding protein
MPRSDQGERVGDDNAERLKTKGTALSESSGLGLLTIEEVAEILKVPVSWVYERTRRRGLDRIPGFRLGKYWRFRAADVHAWLDRQRVGGRVDA